MLYSQGVALTDLRVGEPEAVPLAAWRLYAELYFLFCGTPSLMWLDWALAEVFGLDAQ